MAVSDIESDRALVERALSGDKAAFGGLVDRHRPMAVRLARRMLGDSAEADDAAQEACLHAFLTLSRLRDPERFGAWLYGIVVNLCKMRLRARRTAYALEDWDGGRVAVRFHWSETQLPPEAAYEIRELHTAILRALELLPDEQRAAVRWHYLDGLTLAEIGVLSGAPAGTVKARLHRARERLRAELASLFTSQMRKEIKPMIEVTVKEVIMRVGKPRDVVEAAGRKQPGPDVPDVRVPLPPAGPGVFMLKGDEQKAEVFNLPVSGPPALIRVVLLQERNGERLLPIWIGPHEADMISLQLAGGTAPRPMTYELTARLLEALHATIERVAVSRLHEDVFYATLWVRTGDAVQEVDARPSDAFNLALRVNAPIFVAPEVMDACGVQPDKLQAKLAEGQSETEAVTWISAPAPDMSMPKRPPK
jgi:RNA polymerase sigma factor (sigma-70 family)